MPWSHNTPESPIASLPWTSVPRKPWWERPIALGICALTLSGVLGAALGIGVLLLLQTLWR